MWLARWMPTWQLVKNAAGLVDVRDGVGTVRKAQVLGLGAVT